MKVMTCDKSHTAPMPMDHGQQLHGTPYATAFRMS
ncbi:protein of unknown function [Ralstonia solanacearum PSI07]|nr:protein of unknown function [Ralstonia solanacearum PSI07]